MNLRDHPGNLGAARGTLLTVIHADWPAYPLGDDSFEPLFQLTAFPAGTEFLVVDDMDRALLLTPKIKGAKLDDLFSKRNIHIAAWHEDLAELSKRGFLSGVTSMTEQEYQEFRWKEVQATAAGEPIGFSRGDKFVEVKRPSAGEYDNDPEWMPFVGAREGQISTTTKGRAFVQSELKSARFDIGTGISTKVQKLYELEFFDTCVREACVQLEHEIKHCLHTEQWGDRLVSAFASRMRNEQELLESEVRTFTQEVRSVFKLIRNEYMHNLSRTDALGATIALIRISRARSLLLFILSERQEK